MTTAIQSNRLRRDTRRGLVGGVLAGLAERTGIDVVVLRVLFVVAAVASGGLALLGYVVAWAAIPPAGEECNRDLELARSRAVSAARSAVGVGEAVSFPAS